jgi:opacity protein-like surface antigen
MPVRDLRCAALLLAGLLAPRMTLAQRTGDQSRLIFTVSGGIVLGDDLWSVAAQPVQFIDPTDTFALSRRITNNLGIGFGGTYFPGEHLGIAVEGFLVGLGFEDSCRQVFASGNVDVATACQSIQGATKSATSVFLSAGPVYRINSRSLFSPYVRANLGLVFSNQSSIRTIGRFLSSEGQVDLIVYDDDHDSRVEPALGLGAGITAAVASGYQLRWEVRDNIVGVQTVTGSTPVARVVPPHERTFKHLFSMTIGFDVVLERRRGRRY